MQNRDQNSGSTDYMQRQMAKVKQAQEEYKQRQIAQQPPELKFVPSEYMLHQIALINQVQAERAARIRQGAVKQNTDQERARLGNKR